MLDDGFEVLSIAETDDYNFAKVDDLGKYIMMILTFKNILTVY